MLSSLLSTGLLFTAAHPALNVNKLKYYIASVTKCTGETATFSNTAPHQVACVLNTSQYWHHQQQITL